MQDTNLTTNIGVAISLLEHTAVKKYFKCKLCKFKRKSYNKQDINEQIKRIIKNFINLFWYYLVFAILLPLAITMPQKS